MDGSFSSYSHYDSTVIKSNVEVDIDVDDIDHFVSAWQLITSCTISRVLHTAVELGLFSIMARAAFPVSPEEIVAKLPTIENPDAPSMVDRILRLLATHSLVSYSLHQSGDGKFERRYGLSPMSKFFVPDENGASLGTVLAMFVDPVVQAPWSKLKDAVIKGGIPFNMVHGVHAYEYLSLDPKFNELFNKALFNFPDIIITNILQKYKGFEGIKQLVDVGGGHGHHLRSIVSKYPSISGINFDLPYVIRDALPIPGVEHVVGDMFDTIPQGDAIFMKWVLQPWSDDNCLKVLKNCYEAIPKDGKVIVVEAIVAEEPDTTVTAKAISQVDCFTMTKNPGGKERTQKEFLALSIAAGFKDIQVQCQVGTFWVMEFYK